MVLLYGPTGWRFLISEVPQYLVPPIGETGLFPAQQSTDSCHTPSTSTEEWSVYSREAYRGTSLIRKRRPLGPDSRPMPRVLEGS